MKDNLVNPVVWVMSSSKSPRNPLYTPIMIILPKYKIYITTIPLLFLNVCLIIIVMT